MHQGLNQGCPDHWITIHDSQFLDHGILDVKRSWFAEQDYIILIFVFWVTCFIDLDLLGSYVWSLEFLAFFNLLLLHLAILSTILEIKKV